MWKCHKCQKPVFFAERKQSLGYDWHPECLRCEECGKRLNPGQHAEHKTVPYCSVPCYAALFGPQLFGYGTKVESHKSFGQPQQQQQQKQQKSPQHIFHRSPAAGPVLPRSHLESKLKVFNQFHDNKSLEIRSREVNGRLVLEGALRIHWGVQGVIHLKEDDDQRTVVTVRKRNSCRYRNSTEIGTNDLDKENLGDVTDNEVSNNDTTISESLSYDQISISSEFNSLSEDAAAVPNNNSNATSNNSSQNVSPLHNNSKCITLPSKLSVKNIEWDEFDDLLQVERKTNDSEKLYQTMPSPLPSSQSLTSNSDTVESENVELSEPSRSSQYYSINTQDDDNYETPNGTLNALDFEEFKKQSNYEYINGTNALKSVDEGTLKLNQPIDMSRINDSLKLYNDNIMSKSFNDYYASSSSGASRNFNLQKSESAATASTITGDEKKSSSTDDDTWTPDRGLIRSKSGPNFSGQSFIDSDDEDDANTNTLKASDRVPRSISIRMNCYNDDELNGIGNDDDHIMSPTSSSSVTTTSDMEHPPNHYVTEDGVVLRKPPPKTGSTAIKRRSGNRRSRTKLKRRCSINGHFYNRETSFFTPPHGSQMSVWLTSLVNTQETINLLLEKYKVESKAENFALFIMRDTGEQKKLKEDEYPLVTRVMLGPHEDIARLFIMDAQATAEISSEVAQFLNLSIPECRSILMRFHEEEDRELLRIKEKYAEMRRRIQLRMESLKVRL